MGRLTFYAALTLLYLQWSDAFTPVPTGKEYVYSYSGVVVSLNTEHDYLASQWNISANLIMQSNGVDIAMKFDDIKTSLANGYGEDIDSSKVLPIPEEAHKLYLPFVVHYHKNGSASSLSHQPDEPLWSLNMKRAIASIIQIDTENIEHLHEQKFYEQNIYGNCEVEYSVDKTDSIKTVSKTVDDNLCADSLESSWSSLAPASVIPEGFNPITTTAVRTYHFAQKDDSLLLKTIGSSSNITYQTMHCERSSLMVTQSQVFELLSESTVSKPIDVTKNTESVSLIYFHDDDDEKSGRQPKKSIDSEKLLNDLKGYYEDFKTDFHKYPLTPGDLGVNNSLISMFTALSEMDEDTMVETHLNVLFSDDEEVHSVFLSLLPYIGTNATVKLIKNSLESDALNDLVAIKLMATFPKYINVYTPDLLEKMEVLMNLKEAENRQVKLAGILSFAAMVAEANVRAEMDMEIFEKYHKKFETHFIEANEYEEKMTYLLGLINMGNLLDTGIMISIITDKEQSHHIRSLATYGFKPFLLDSQKIFNQLWNVVKNHAEHFEVRVAVLDLLMSSALTSEEFNIIIEEFNKESDDQVEQHLQNYLSTTLESLQNTTMYHDNLGALATDSAERVTIPSYYDAWSTGNYRIGYTDAAPNFGSYFQARLVANPITNVVNVVQLSSNQFAFSLNLGTYTAYIKLDGVADFLFINYNLADRPNDDIAIPQLVELLKKFNYKLVQDLVMHIEVVLFSDDRAVFGMHINKDNVDKYAENPLFADLLKLLVDYEYVTFPKLSSKTLRSDLGTHVEAYHIDTNVVSHKLKIDLDTLTDDSEIIKHAELNYRSSKYESICLETYNPVMDVSINVYKFRSNAQRLYLPIALNVTGEYFTFDNINDTINVMLDRSIGIIVDDPEKLAEFGTCEAHIEVPMTLHREKMLQLEDFGIEFNVTVAEAPVMDHTNISQLFDSFKSNSLTIPVAEPLLFYWYAMDYYRYLEKEVEFFSLRSMAFYEEPTENVWEWDFDIDDVYNENDPINGTEVTVFSRISCRRKHDTKILSSIGVSYSYSDAPVSHEKSGTTHVEEKHKFRADYTDDDTHYIACLDRQIQYPSRKSDKWSISTVEPAKGKGRFSAGTTDETKACSNDFSISFTDIFESSDKLLKNVKNMKEYKTCKRDSEGLKYTPPTDACYTVHDAVSKYSNYTLYLDLKNAGKLSKYDKMFRTSDRGMKFLQMYYVEDDVARIMVSKDFFDAVGVDSDFTDGIVDREVSLGIFSGIEDPTTIAYDDYDAVIGLSATCDITPGVISTFTGKEITNYESKDNKEIVAYVECIDETRGGMTIQKFSDKKIGFTMWSGNDTLITSVAGDKLKIVLNGEELDKQYTSDRYFKVYFLEDDVLYITNQLVQVYYNTEYISIKAPSIYNTYVCGLCAHENKFNTDNQVN